MLSPVGSFDHELGELERQLTDTRKSIDAKFYKSLANSSSPFFRPSAKANATRLSSPSDYNTFSEENDFPIGPGGFQHRDSSGADDPTDRRKTTEEGFATTKSFHTEVTFEPLKFSGSPPHSTSPQMSSRKLRNRNESMEQAMKNPRRSVVEESTAFITPSSPSKNSRQFIRNADPITFEIYAKGGQVTRVKPTNSGTSVEDKKSTGDSGSFSDSSILLNKGLSGSSEVLLSDNDAGGPNRKGSLVKTKVREASDIIHERSYGRDSPIQRDVISRKTHSVDHTNTNEHVKLAQRSSSHQPTTTGGSAAGKPLINTSIKEDDKTAKSFTKSHSPKLNSRDSALVKALGSAARNKQVPPTVNVAVASLKNDSSKIILDDSLTDTFAKLESAFSLKPATPDSSVRDERRKKRRSYAKRRSRNFEPSSTDSSGDDDSSVESRRRSSGLRIQLKSRNDDPDTCSIASNKSEAEQSLEAAISDFHNSLSTMPQKNKHHSFYSSDQSEDAPKVPSRSRPLHSRYIHTRENRSKSIDFTATSRPLTGLESKSMGNVEQVKRRSEAKITLTSARPWSPPLKQVQPSANIRHNVSKGNRPKALVLVKNYEKMTKQTSEEVFEVEEQIITETSVEDQLSPLPGVSPPRNLSGYSKDSTVASRYTNSLPGRSKKRRSSYKSEKQHQLRSKSSKLQHLISS